MSYNNTPLLTYILDEKVFVMPIFIKYLVFIILDLLSDSAGKLGYALLVFFAMLLV